MPTIAIAFLTATVLVVAPAQAQDTVFLKPHDPAAATSKWVGEILDYTGAELRLKTNTGKERAIPADQVLSVSTPLTEAHRAADELFAAHDFKGALAQYRAALGADKERRPWVRRQIVAQIVWCYRDLGQVEQAGQTFLQVLIPGDGVTQYFDCIPLAWTAGLPSPNLERAAAAWFANADSPVAALLGASHLLGTSQRPAALERLKRMTTDRDRRLAWLAQAQVWRATVFQANQEQLLGYLRAIKDCPEALRAGPYFVVGSALAKFRPKEATLALLRLPILYPRERQLASAALLAAGGILHDGGQSEEAAQLYQELLGDYRETPEAAEAERRLAAGRPKP